MMVSENNTQTVLQGHCSLVYVPPLPCRELPEWRMVQSGTLGHTLERHSDAKCVIHMNFLT